MLRSAILGCLRRLAAPLKVVLTLAFCLRLLSTTNASDILPLPTPKIEDHFTPVDPACVQIHGVLGRYVAAVRTNFVLCRGIISTYLEPLEKGGDKFWNSEHIGKWLDTAASIWKNTGDLQIRRLMDEAVERIARAQKPNGYLGGYDEPHRFYQVNWNARSAPAAWDDDRHGWDLWCNFMSLEGLLKYHRLVPSDTRALETARRIGELIVTTFGEGKQDITLVPHDNGIGAMTSLLGAMHLYEETGDKQFLEFSEYIVRQFGRPNSMPIILFGAAGPQGDRFPFAANGAVVKHAETEIVLRGLCELYRMTGEDQLFATCSKVYQTGYAPLTQTMCLSGYGAVSPNVPLPRVVRQKVETCDIPPMLRWWVEMFRLSGDCRYLDAVEREVYNQLLAHRAPDGRAFEYMPCAHFDSPSGCTRKYCDLDHFSCCWSMGPVGFADVPSWCYFTDKDGFLVNFYEDSTLHGSFNGVPVQLSLATDYPLAGRVRITVQPQNPMEFTLKLRMPSWCSGATVRVNGRSSNVKPSPGTIFELRRLWRPQDQVALDLPMDARWIPSPAVAPGCGTIERGPLVLAMTQRFNNNGDGWSYAAPVIGGNGRLSLSPVQLKDSAGLATTAWRIGTLTRFDEHGKIVVRKTEATLVPFYQAGLEGEPYVAAFPLVLTLEHLPPHLLPEHAANIASASAGVVAAADSQSTTNAPALVCDGNASTCWCSSTNPFPHWVELRFPEPRAISRLIVHFADRKNHPVDFQLLARTGSSDFQSLGQVTGCNLSDYYWLKFPQRELDTLRLVIQSSSDPDITAAEISEIESYAR